MRFTRAWAIDATERVITTFVEAFVTAVVASGAIGISSTGLENAGLSALVATASLVKSIAAGLIGNPDSASLVPSVGAPVPLGGPVVGADQVIPIPVGPHHLVGPPDAVARVRIVQD